MGEVIDMLLALLDTPGGLNKKQDQLVLLMYEPNMAELLYVLIADSSYPVILKEKILKVGEGCVFNVGVNRWNRGFGGCVPSSDLWN